MIEKLNFKNAETIRDDFGVIEDKIDEIIDVVNLKIAVLEGEIAVLKSKNKEEL